MTVQEPTTKESRPLDAELADAPGNSPNPQVTPELFIGVILPQGVPWDSLTQALRTVLKWLGYRLTIIRLTDEFRRISSPDPEKHAFHWDNVAPDDWYRKTRDGVAELCKLLGKDVMAYLAINRVYESRPPLERDDELGVAHRHAYCFQSLKRPEEVEALRAVYGRSFICIAAHLPREEKLEALAKRFAAEKFHANPNKAKPEAEEQLSHDEGSGREDGERVSFASSKADIFVDVNGTRNSIIDELWRSMSSLFGSPFLTPTPDEQGMSIAYLAALRSAHPKRQVGAALTTADGSILAIGCNEVPAPQGGLYWTGDTDDRRDFQLQEYASRAMREEVLGDVLKRLVSNKYLSEDKTSEFYDDPRRFFQRLNLDRELNDSRLMDAIEYDRTVHAEMAAITDAARRGVLLQGCTLYCTTLPCHNCSRHIVATGIKRVVYIQPFEKSLASRLHDDAISVDPRPGTEDKRVKFEHFIGVAPGLYPFVFSFPAKGRLKDDGREFIEWLPEESEPVISRKPWIYLAVEAQAVKRILREVEAKGLELLERKSDEQSSEI